MNSLSPHNAPVANQIKSWNLSPNGSARTPWDRAVTPIASVDVEDEVAVKLVIGLSCCHGLYCYWGPVVMLDQTEPVISNLSCPTPRFFCRSPFSTLFSMVRPFADWVAPPPSVSKIPLPRPKSRAPIHELILLMLGQCTNPGPSYPCPVCLHLFKKSQML